MRKRKVLVPVVFASLALLGGCAGGGGAATTVDGETELVVTPRGNELAETNVKLGVGYFQQGNYEYALKKFRKALEIDDNLPNGHYAIALLYDRLGKPSTAEKHFQRSIELNPQYSDAYNAYAAFLCRKEDFERADQNFQKALSNPLYRSPILVEINAGLCAMRDKNYTRAEEYFRKVLQRNAQMPTALFEMSRLNYEAKRYLPARAYFQRYTAAAKHTAQTLLLGIKIERELGDRDALASYKLLLLKQFPDSDEARELQKLEK